MHSPPLGICLYQRSVSSTVAVHVYSFPQNHYSSSTEVSSKCTSTRNNTSLALVYFCFLLSAVEMHFLFMKPKINIYLIFKYMYIIYVIKILQHSTQCGKCLMSSVLHLKFGEKWNF